MSICTNCGKEVQDDIKFCTSCGAKIEAEASTQPEKEKPKEQEQQIQSVQKEQEIQQSYIQPPPVAVSPAAAETKPISSIKYWSYLFIMGLPLMGLVVSILWSRKKEPSNRRNLARAMIFYSAVCLVVCIMFMTTLHLLLQAKDLFDMEFKLFGIKIF